jgi:predicted nucleotidyltransferase
MRKISTAALYAREYPRLITTLERIAERTSIRDDLPINLLALFGSVARLTPHVYSDTDLLVLFHDNPGRDAFNHYTLETIRIIRRAEDETVDEQYRWPIMPIPGDERASDLDPDFVATVGREGVLLYQRPGAYIPDALAQLETFDHWQRRVGERLAGRHPLTSCATS